MTSNRPPHNNYINWTPTKRGAGYVDVSNTFRDALQ